MEKFMPFLLPEPIAEALLSKLGSDDDFRELFVRDTRQALASLGFEPAADASIKQGIWNCMGVAELASKEAIQNGLAVLQTQLKTCATFNPISLGFRPDTIKNAA